MKFNCLLIFLVFFFTVSYSQVSTSKIYPDENKIPVNPRPYDSTKNYLGKFVYQYIGQELFVKPKTQILQEFGYENFYNHPTPSEYDENKKIYKCCQSFNSIYDSLEGKYFKVLDVVDPELDLFDDPRIYQGRLFLKLLNKQTLDTCYYYYDVNTVEGSFPFTVVGYFLKLKRKYVGRTYITLGRGWIGNNSTVLDVETGKNVSVSAGKTWKCTDLTIEDRFEEIALVLKNSINETIAIEINQLRNQYYIKEKLPVQIKKIRTNNNEPLIKTI